MIYEQDTDLLRRLAQPGLLPWRSEQTLEGMPVLGQHDGEPKSVSHHMGDANRVLSNRGTKLE